MNQKAQNIFQINSGSSVRFVFENVVKKPKLLTYVSCVSYLT
jgi:hypothetical protein